MNENTFYKRLQITEIIQASASAKTFKLEALDGWQPNYRSGQFLTLAFVTKHGEKRRSYSISSSPDADAHLSITVKKLDNGEFSRLLNFHAKVGDILYTSGISGFFTLPEKPENFEQYFFMAAGSGITPCFSMIKTLLLRTDRNVVLIYSNKSKEETIFLNELNELQKTFAQRFQIQFLFSNIFNVYESRLSNWLLPQLLKKLMTSPAANCRFYICGPYEYMQMTEITLLMQAPKDNIVKENFTHWPRLILPVPPDVEKHKVAILLNGEKFELNVQYPVSILAEAKKQNISLPYSCEAGSCGSCAATCTSGEIWMAYNEVLTDSEVAKGRVLVCQSYPVNGDVRLEF